MDLMGHTGKEIRLGLADGIRPRFHGKGADNPGQFLDKPLLLIRPFIALFLLFPAESACIRPLIPERGVQHAGHHMLMENKLFRTGSVCRVNTEDMLQILPA